MEPHADFAVPVMQPLWMETARERPAGEGAIAGRALALGWWVDKPGDPPHKRPATGVLYLIADESLQRPVWIAQDDITAFRLV